MKPTKRMFFLVILAMISFAMIDNVRGLFVPSFKENYLFNNTEIGWVLLLNSLAYAIASFFAGRLIVRFNQQKILMLGTVISITGIASMVFLDTRLSFFLAMILMNVGIAFSGLAINTTIPKLKVKNHAVLMNFVHFLYGVGATITQKSAGLLLLNGWNFKNIYLTIMIVYVIVFLVAGFTKLPEEHAESRVNKPFTKGQWWVIGLISIGLGLYVSGEIQTGNWLVDYGKNTFQLDENAMSTFTAIFFFIFSIGRLLGGFAAQKIGYLKSVTLSIFTACLMYTIGLIFKYNGLWIIAFSGIFFSIVYPTVILVLKDYFEESITKAAGLVVTFSSAVNMLIGLFIGKLADVIGIRFAMFCIPVSLLLSALLFSIVYWKGYALIKKYQNTH